MTHGRSWQPACGWAMVGWSLLVSLSVPAGAQTPEPEPAPAVETLPAAPGTAAPGGMDRSPEQGLGFADQLFAERDYYRAITEYKRVIFLFPADPRIVRARLAIARAYAAGGKHALAASHYLELAADRAHPPEAAEALFQAAECYFRGQQYALAEAHYRTFLSEQATHPLAEQARYRIAWTFIGRQQLPAADQHLETIPATSPYRPAAERLHVRLGELGRVRQRSLVAAGLLAGLLPGAGHVYAGDPANGLLALGVNGVFAFGTYEAAAHENYTAAVVLGLFGLGFYLGNIFGAANAAARENELAQRQALSDLVRELQDPVIAPPSASAPSVSLAFPGHVVLRW